MTVYPSVKLRPEHLELVGRVALRTLHLEGYVGQQLTPLLKAELVDRYENFLLHWGHRIGSSVFTDAASILSSCGPYRLVDDGCGNALLIGAKKIFSCQVCDAMSEPQPVGSIPLGWQIVYEEMKVYCWCPACLQAKLERVVLER